MDNQNTERKSSAPFCTCDNYECQLHPSNHDQGCNPCMEKNLRVGHVPNCMLYAVSREEHPDNYTYSGFADFVKKTELKKRTSEL